MILVTGANGFVGQRLCQQMRQEGLAIRGAYRTDTPQTDIIEPTRIGSIDADTDWTLALKNIQGVVHLAARVHVMNDKSAHPLAEFRRVNVDGTARLARQAAAAGVKRFVFLSSVKVNGEATVPGSPFTASDAPTPQDPYGISKQEAEQVLRDISAQTDMEVVIIRPPLVYGPGVKANFAAMMRWLAKGHPLPLGAITDNRRSLVALDNLTDLILICLKHPAAANETFLASDGEDLSTAELLRRMGQALGTPARLVAISPRLLAFGAALIGKDGIYQRLCGSLQVDITKTRNILGWTPPVSVDEGLRRAAHGVLK